MIPIQGGQGFQPIAAGVVVGMAMGSGGGFGVKRQRLGGPLSQRFSLQHQAVSVVNQPVQHGVGDGRVANDLVPMIVTSRAILTP